MLRALEPGQDAFGHLLRDFHAGLRVVEVVERDDGCVFTGEVSYYFAPFRSWWPQERRAMRFVRGRVLDIGCGAGRLGLHLQSRGRARLPARNRARGKLGGIERLRIRYRRYATPWYDVLFASREEVTGLVEGTGWVASRFVDDGAGYVAVLDRETAR